MNLNQSIYSNYLKNEVLEISNTINISFIENNNSFNENEWKELCGTCAKQKPILEKAKKDFENIIFMNFEQTKNKDIAELLKIDYWTTIAVYKDNKELAREIGLYN